MSTPIVSPAIEYSTVGRISVGRSKAHDAEWNLIDGDKDAAVKRLEEAIAHLKIALDDLTTGQARELQAPTTRRVFHSLRRPMQVDESLVGGDL